ncbi:arginine kinase [Drosophila mojavensis]|uniref:arginine kinase n=3 Tax=mojavensis species complex TaxID=198037 RepID=B4L9H1_DROMO|nr:arginine kinase [Drosophila mojavensis]EDW17346.2 Tes114 [Drosophila mojavensis]
MNSIRLVRTLTKCMSVRPYSMAPCEILELLEAGYQKLADSDSKSLLKKHLTKPIFDKLKTKVTPSYCSTLLDCIQSGLCNLDSNVGIYAPDPEAYQTFAEIFDPIINDYHKGFGKGAKHPASCFGYGADFPDLDPEQKFILSTRVRCGRSIQDFPFNPCLSEDDYRKLECMITKVLSTLCNEHAGKYYPLAGMEKDVQQKLIDKHYLFKEGDRFLQAANASRFWPTGRGIFINRARTFLVWVNEEDHIRIISMERGGDLGRVYERMIIGLESLAYSLKFSSDSRLGNLTFCPTNLGTTIRASVHIKLPHLGKDRAKLEEMAKKHNLQVRGTSGEHTEAKDGVYDISNTRRMGLTEYQAVGEMHKGISALIEAECQECCKK